MGTSKTELGQWFDYGVTEGKARMIVWCDTYDYEDYPEYTNLTGDELRAHIDKRNGVNMTKLMEVYDLTSDKSSQLNSLRAFNY